VTVQEKPGQDAVVVTIFSDDDKKYLGTALFREEPIRETYASPDVELLDFQVIGRLGSQQARNRFVA
jgi:cysteine synthase